MNQPIISLIAAIGKNRELGNNNQLPWHIPQDLKRFKDLTTGHVVIMGQKTFQSLGRSLPDRINVVLTNNPNFKCDGCLMASSLADALAIAKKHEQQEIFFIGGGSVYQQAIALVDRLYLTLVEGNYPADTFFPDYADFTKLIDEQSYDDGQYRFTCKILERS